MICKVYFHWVCKIFSG